MKNKRGAKKTLTNKRICIFILEGEQKSYIDALAAGRKVSQSKVVRDMVTYWADGHKIQPIGDGSLILCKCGNVKTNESEFCKECI